MEDKLKWKKLKEFIFALLGMIIGLTIYDLLGYTNNISRFFFGITFVIIARALYDIYRNLRYPDLKEKEKQLEKDERNIFIRYKAGYISLIMTFAILVILYVVAVIQENHLIIYLTSGILIYMVVVMEIGKYYLNKRL